MSSVLQTNYCFLFPFLRKNLAKNAHSSQLTRKSIKNSPHNKQRPILSEITFAQKLVVRKKSKYRYAVLVLDTLASCHFGIQFFAYRHRHSVFLGPLDENMEKYLCVFLIFASAADGGGGFGGPWWGWRHRHFLQKV